ncbi:MAG: hypothetical protein H6837_19960 [Planctomycetes bacterium]|nr:hypothetical protein [Planctomycetota bacterium]
MRRAVYRRGYYLAMYSGVRALWNRAHSRARPLPPPLRALCGVRLPCAGVGELALRVHARRGPMGAAVGSDHGFFSLRLVVPGVGAWTYRFLCATSHFGCGHVEVAFYEIEGVVTFYGVRNLASGNAHRLGWRQLAKRLQLTLGQEACILGALSRLLRENGFAVAHAAPRDCVDLSVDDRLVPVDAALRVRRSLQRKYQRLQTAVHGM